MAFMYVLPKHIWEDVEDPVAFGNEEMIGSGPFKLVQAGQGESRRACGKQGLLGSAAQHRRRDLPDDRRTGRARHGADDRRGRRDHEFPATAMSDARKRDNITVHIADVAAGGSLRTSSSTSRRTRTARRRVASAPATRPSRTWRCARRWRTPSTSSRSSTSRRWDRLAGPLARPARPRRLLRHEVEDYAFDVDAANRCSTTRATRTPMATGFASASRPGLRRPDLPVQLRR